MKKLAGLIVLGLARIAITVNTMSENKLLLVKTLDGVRIRRLQSAVRKDVS